MKIWHSCVACAGFLALLTGCDRHSTVVVAPASRHAPAAPKPPQWKPLQLADYPLVIDAPEGWKIEPVRMVLFLQGPIPSGAGPEKLVHAQVSRQPSVPSHDLMLSRLEGEKQIEPGETLIKQDVRKAGDATILEKRTRQKGSDGLPDRLDWSLTVYVPSEGGAWTPYHIEFIDLTFEEYEHDHAMLEKMLASIRVDTSLSPHDTDATPR